MAEVAGLALSGVALASLITSCIDIIEYWDNGRFWINDLGLAITKVSLLKARISQLGNVLPAAAKEEDDEHSTCHVALQGLSGVDAVLRQTNELCRRYSYLPLEDRRPITTPNIKTCQTGESPHKRQVLCAMSVQKTGSGSPRTWRQLGKRVCWVVQDKRRFDRLISDLEQLLSSIEKLVSSLQDEDAHAPLRILSSLELSSQKDACRSSPKPAEVEEKGILKSESRQNHQMSPSHSTHLTSELPNADPHLENKSNTSAKRKPQPHMSKAQKEDAFVANNVEEFGVLSRGGIYTSDGQLVMNGHVHVERNTVKGSVMVVGPQTSSDFQSALDHVKAMHATTLSVKELPATRQ